MVDGESCLGTETDVCRKHRTFSLFGAFRAFDKNYGMHCTNWMLRNPNDESGNRPVVSVSASANGDSSQGVFSGTAAAGRWKSAAKHREEQHREEQHSHSVADDVVFPPTSASDGMGSARFIAPPMASGVPPVAPDR